VPRCEIPDLAAASRDVLERCRGLGFALGGIAPAQASRWREEVLAWLRAGKHGQMDYLERDLDLKFEPAGVFPDTQAFIMVADLYATRNEAAAETPVGHGRVARYAQGRDYHVTIKNRLHDLSDALRAAYPGWGFRSFVDTVPVLERELAVQAGLGWQAKNTMVINPRVGSYLLLGGVATSMPLVVPAEQPVVQDHCGTCTRCIDACPTGAITPWSVDGSRCISYLTIEHRDRLDPAVHGAMGEWVYGCDVCQEVCPHNSARDGEVGERPAAYEPRNVSLPLLEVLGWDDAARRERFRNSAMKRATLAMMKRNAVIAAGNLLRVREVPELRARLVELSLDVGEAEMVRGAAGEVLAGLKAPR